MIDEELAAGVGVGVLVEQTVVSRPDAPILKLSKLMTVSSIHPQVKKIFSDAMVGVKGTLYVCHSASTEEKTVRVVGVPR